MTRERKRQQVVSTAVALLVVGSLLTVGAGALGAKPATTDGVTAIQETADEQQANVSVENLTVPSQIEVGQNYTVTATVVNRRGEAIVQDVVYRIAGNVIESKLVRVDADATQTVVFNVTENDTGGFPTGTFVHGVFAEGAEATANLTIVAAGETTTPANETPTPTNETPTPAETTTPANGTTTTTPAETTPANETTTAQVQTASVEFENQTSNGTLVTVQSVIVPEGGFVAIHDRSIVDGDVTGSFLGVSEYLEPGTHANVTVRLDAALNESQELVAVTYRDSNENQTFDFFASNRTEDGPYTREGSNVAVNDFAVVTVTENATQQNETQG